MEWHFFGESNLEEWLLQDPPDGELVVGWVLNELLVDPLSVDATVVPVFLGLPWRVTSVPGTHTFVTFTVAQPPAYEVPSVYLVKVETLSIL